METKQTAVEWLFDKITQNQEIRWRGTQYRDLFEQAKQMEKEQMKDAFVACWESNVPDGIECKLDAEQYYNETYGN